MEVLHRVRCAVPGCVTFSRETSRLSSIPFPFSHTCTCCHYYWRPPGGQLVLQSIHVSDFITEWCSYFMHCWDLLKTGASTATFHKECFIFKLQIRTPGIQCRHGEAKVVSVDPWDPCWPSWRDQGSVWERAPGGSLLWRHELLRRWEEHIVVVVLDQYCRLF